MSNEREQAPRVVVVGLDGASFELLDPWIRAGEMPNLERLVDRGVSGGLESVLPPMTPPAWTSAVTGVYPGKHGIYNFIRPFFGRFNVEFCGTAHRKAPALWDFLTARGLSSLILHLPATFPPPRLEGCLVSGYPITTLDADCTYPRELKTELREAVPGYKLYPDTVNIQEDRDAYFEDSVETLRRHAEETLHLMRTKPWSLLFALWHMGDPLKHYFWRDMDGETGDETRRHYIRDYYREADRCLGQVIKEAGERSHVIVMSDHGHRGVKRAVHLNEWLSRNGYLRVRIPASFVLEQLTRKIRRRLHLPARTAAPSGDRFEKNMRAGELMVKSVVWRETQAYATRPGFIFLNLKGREAAGVVEPGDDARRVRDRIREGLLGVRDPQTNEPVFEEIFVGEDVYKGPATGDAPDLVVLPRAGYSSEYSIKKPGVVGPVRERGFNGYHVLRGMLAMAGPEVREGNRVEGARIVDMAPTILHLLGLPAEATMDGRVLERALRPEALAARPVRTEAISVDFAPDADASAESDSIAQSLRDLGYM